MITQKERDFMLDFYAKEWVTANSSNLVEAFSESADAHFYPFIDYMTNDDLINLGALVKSMITIYAMNADEVKRKVELWEENYKEEHKQNDFAG